MFVFETQLRVRYAETDQMGYVYYGNYAAFYEVARTEMLRSTGISYKELEDMGVMLPVTDLQCHYIHISLIISSCFILGHSHLQFVGVVF